MVAPVRERVQDGLLEGAVVAVRVVERDESLVAEVDVPLGPFDPGGESLIVDQARLQYVDQGTPADCNCEVRLAVVLQRLVLAVQDVLTDFVVQCLFLRVSVNVNHCN